MAGDSEFRWVTGKVRVTGDPLGTGGTRRSDGTLSSQVHDLRYLDNEPRTEFASSPGPAQGGSLATAMVRQFGEQALSAAISVLIEEVVVPGTAKLWREQVVPAVSRKWQERRARSRANAGVAAEVVEAELVEPEVPQSDIEVQATEGPLIEITRDEAEWRIAEAQRAARELADHLAVLRAARIVEDPDIPALLEGRGHLEAAPGALESDGDADGEKLAHPADASPNKDEGA